MKQRIKLTESELGRIVMESAKRILKEEYDSNAQWKDELKAFMRGLRNGDYFEENGTVYVQIWKSRTAENDPRYVYYRKGDTCLHDDGFYMQNSPRLSTRAINAINKRLGWNSEYDEDGYDY